jgi:hypothetical protein
MRWNNLFNDLEAQLDRELAAEDADERRDTARAAVAIVGQRQVLLALAKDYEGSVLMRTSARRFTVTVDTVGADWVAVTEIDPGTSRCTPSQKSSWRPVQAWRASRVGT